MGWNDADLSRTNGWTPYLPFPAPFQCDRGLQVKNNGWGQGADIPPFELPHVVSLQENTLPTVIGAGGNRRSLDAGTHGTISYVQR